MSDTTTDVETPTEDDQQQPDADTPDVDSTDAGEHAEQDDDQPEDRTGSREAAKYRRQLRATETERDQLRDQMAAQRRAFIDWRSANAVGGAVDPELLDAAGIDVDTLLDPDTGQLDMDLVDRFIDDTAVKFRVQRTVKPNPQQGQPSQGAGASWASVIKQGAKSG